MPSIKTTINLSSTNLFPTPVNVTKSPTLTINGDKSGFTTNVLAPGVGGQNVVIYGPSTAGQVYFFFEAASTNGDTVDVEIVQGGTVSALRLAAGDIAWLPVDCSVLTTVRLDNNDGVAEAVVYYFYGEKA